jgi:hypothetical protein
MSMNPLHLDPGIYLNVFPVELPNDEIQVLTVERTLFQDLRQLRDRLKRENKKAWVYACGNKVYAYGPEVDALKPDGFERHSLRLIEEPRLATRMIVKGLANTLREERYQILYRKGRCQAYHPDQFKPIVGGSVRVHRGYDLRALFWRDVVADRLTFGLVVDATWMLRDSDNHPLGLQQIRQQYGYNVTIAIGQVQEEYLPGSSKFNTEVARQRLQAHITPFVQSHPGFDLPCGGQVRLLSEPVRVILGGEER